MFVKNINGEFWVDDKPFRFIGANVYELANVEPPIAKKIIEASAAEGFKVLRFWLFQNRAAGEQIKKLNEICDMVKPYGIRLIISLSDKWGYLQNYKIDDNWYKGEYKDEYLGYVKSITGECKMREEIMIWELINEPETDSFETFYDFAKNTSEEIKSVNTNHLLSIGTVGGIGDKFGGYFSIFKTSNFEKLYLLPSIDAVSIHDYSYDSGIFERLDMLYRFKGEEKKARLSGKIDSALNFLPGKADKWFLKRGKLFRAPLGLRQIWNSRNKRNIKFARRIKKPLYIGEAGFKAGAGRDRKKILELDIMEKFSLGASGYMLWSFEAEGWNRDGHEYGFKPEDGFGNVVRKWNETI